MINEVIQDAAHGTTVAEKKASHLVDQHLVAHLAHGRLP